VTFQDLLKSMVERRASDLHLIAGLKPALRIRGELVPLTEAEKLSPNAARDLIYSVLTDHQKTLFESDPAFRNELDFGYGVPGLGRFRFNVHRQRGTVAAAARNNIRAGKPEAINQTLQTSQAEGMQTMDQHLIQLCRDGVVDYETARPYIHEKTTHETIRGSSRPAARPGRHGSD
jgi:Tfp pilus assembly pilus retraction ATPase PilT